MDPSIAARPEKALRAGEAITPTLAFAEACRKHTMIGTSDGPNAGTAFLLSQVEVPMRA